MVQFDVFANREASAREVPYLLVVQADLLAGLATRAVVPLWRRDAWRGAPIRILQPQVQVNGDDVIARFDQVTHVPCAVLGKPVANLASERAAFIHAIELLF